MYCDIIYGCALHEDTVHVDLKIHILKGIETLRKDYKL